MLEIKDQSPNLVTLGGGAVSQIAVKDQLVWPNKREPTATTLLYYKMDWNATDSSWNSRDGSYPWGTPTFDMNEWRDWCYNWGRAIRMPSLWSFGSWETLTISFWLKATANQWLFWLTNYNHWDRNNMDVSMDSWKIFLSVWTWSSATWTARWDNLLDWEWHWILITKNWNNYTWYIDWEQKSTWSNSSTIIAWDYSQIGCHPNTSWQSVWSWVWIDEFLLDTYIRDENYRTNYYKIMKKYFR